MEMVSVPSTSLSLGSWGGVWGHCGDTSQGQQGSGVGTVWDKGIAQGQGLTRWSSAEPSRWCCSPRPWRSPCTGASGWTPATPALSGMGRPQSHWCWAAEWTPCGHGWENEAKIERRKKTWHRNTWLEKLRESRRVEKWCRRRNDAKNDAGMEGCKKNNVKMGRCKKSENGRLQKTAQKGEDTKILQK